MQEVLENYWKVEDKIKMYVINCRATATKEVYQ